MTSLICMVLRARGSKNSRDGCREFLPSAGFDLELPLPTRGQGVKLCAPIVVGGPRRDGNPTAFDKPVQRRIERSLTDPKYTVRPELDGLGDGVTVLGARFESLENQEIEGALKQFDALLSSFRRHTGSHECSSRRTRTRGVLWRSEVASEWRIGIAHDSRSDVSRD